MKLTNFLSTLVLIMSLASFVELNSTDEDSMMVDDDASMISVVNQNRLLSSFDDNSRYRRNLVFYIHMFI